MSANSGSPCSIRHSLGVLRPCVDLLAAFEPLGRPPNGWQTCAMAKAEKETVPWVIDTCMVIDVLEDDPVFGASSAEWIDSHSGDGLCVCPVTYSELAPAFQGNRTLQDEFLAGVGIAWRQDWVWNDTICAHAAWHRHIQRRRGGQGPKRPLADILIGAWAVRYRGLLTRNPGDFRAAFPDLQLRVPAS